MPFSITWNESYPAGSDTAAGIDTYIQQDKIAVRERLESLLGISDFATRYPMTADSFKMNGTANPKIVAGTGGLKIRNSVDALDLLSIDGVTGAGTFTGTVSGMQLATSTGLSTAAGIKGSNFYQLFPAQITTIAAGSDLFTPTTGVMYSIKVFGKDISSGAPTNSFVDEIIVYSNGTVTITVLHSTTTNGAPGARTYSNNGGALKLAIGSGVTWYIDLVVLRNV